MLIDENLPKHQIAECNEVVVSKLARIDYPNLWYLSSLRNFFRHLLRLHYRPTLIDDLVQILDSNLRQRYTSGDKDFLNSLRIRRSLKLLNVVIKEFSTIKLPNGMKTMTQVCRCINFKPLSTYESCRLLHDCAHYSTITMLRCPEHFLRKELHLKASPLIESQKMFFSHIWSTSAW